MATNSTTTRAAAQGILQGGNPSHYDSSNPIVMFIIQAGIIIILCRLVHWPLSKIRQPRVIAEVISGIILGPSVMGHIPGFTETIFPTASLPSLSVVANLGLIIFLFLVGLETDLRFLVSNWRVALSVSAAGMILPFALGCAISYGLYNQFHDDPGTVPVAFGTYLLFIGIAMAITAFPVLCRILTELKLLGTNVGVIVLSAGVGNDVVGWILLALCVALVNAGSGITALYVLLVAAGYVLFLVFAFRPLIIRFLERTGSLQKGPRGFAIKLTEKIEDLVAALFLPLYFTLSGLSTNLGLLNTGTVWGYVVGIIAIAFTAKVAGGAIASRFCGMLWRESFAIGVLMSCKGLVELIVLNIGLQAKILSTQTFTMFVVMALVTTFMTTPLTVSLYPNWYQIKVDRWRRGEIDWNDNSVQKNGRSDSVSAVKEQLSTVPVRKLLVYLRLDGLSGLCTLAALLSPNRGDVPLPQVHPANKSKQSEQSVEDADQSVNGETTALRVHGVRLMELTDRDSSVMKVAAGDQALWDPVVNTFRAFGEWHDLSLMAGVSVVPEYTYADTVVNMAHRDSLDLLLLPWSETGILADRRNGVEINPSDRFSSGEYAGFVSDILKRVSGHVAILVDHIPEISANRPTSQHRSSWLATQGSSWTRPSMGSRSHHIVFPFFGGEDDRFALRFVLQLAKNDHVTATIIHIPGSQSDLPRGTATSSAASDVVFFETIRESIPADLQERVVFQAPAAQDTISDPGQLALAAVRAELEQNSNKPGSIVIVGRRSYAVEPTIVEPGVDEISVGTGTRQALGAIGSLMVRPENKVFSSVLVLQAGTGHLSDIYH
ncbi:hypothetical protein N7513_003673 [Penicillium frequentans]|nr:hypothetical protein N7513_003673 [Penicillium glabrum]